jgi:diacylglycerol O-acyltransferase / trehalose O-mycolyltransferase
VLAPPTTGAALGWPACVQRTAPIHLGLTEVSRSANGRLLTLRLRSRAMEGEQKVDVLLPRGFDRSGRTRYPVLYLLHGAGGDYRTWVEQDEAAQALAGLPVIAVMPDGSGPDKSGVRRNGGYSDWFGVEPNTPDRAFAWESYHVRELVPFIDRRFPTRAAPGGRAIAGISMGGTGAMKYAAEFPGTFGYAGSFSGGIDSAVARGLRGQNCQQGDPALEQVIWRDNNPTDLASNLRGVRLFVRSGDGTPGPFDSPTKPVDPGEATVWQARLATEAGAHAMAENFLRALRKAGIRGVDAGFYAGSHSHPYWTREFRAFVTWLRAQLRRPPAAPDAFTVASAHLSFSAWGWSFRAHRRAREFAYLRVRAGSLTVTGSGDLDVTTPALYRPRMTYAVQIGQRTKHVRADRRGRLAFRLDLGPSHTKQQTDFGARATRGWRSVSARVLKTRPGPHVAARDRRMLGIALT